MEGPFMALLSAARESYRSPSYNWENRGRASENLWVLQRTTRGRAFIENASGNYQNVREGQLMLFRHDDGSRYGYPEDFEGEYALEFISVRGGLADVFGYRLKKAFGEALAISFFGRASALFADILDRFERRRFSDDLEVSALLYQLFMEIWREQGGATQTVDAVDYARATIETRFALPITVEEIARELGLSREHLARQYKERFGESPGRSLKRLRLARAKSMLATSSLDVERVALACGYAGSNSFCRSFKDAFGESPKAFRLSSRVGQPVPA